MVSLCPRFHGIGTCSSTGLRARVHQACADHNLDKLCCWATHRDLEQLLSLAVELLPVAQQRTALRLRFGLADGRWRTLQQVADAMGRSQETARTNIASGVRSLESVLAKLRLTGAVEAHMAAASSQGLVLDE